MAERRKSEVTKGRAKPTIGELEEGLRIDKDDLDKEVEQHPTLLYNVGLELEMAISQRDAAKQNIKEVESRVYLSLRKWEEDSEGKKVSEAQMSHLVTSHKDVLAANEDYEELAAKVGKLRALKEAYQARSAAMRDLVQLYLANYYSDVSNAGNRLKGRHSDLAKEEMSRERRRRSNDD